MRERVGYENPSVVADGFFIKMLPPLQCYLALVWIVRKITLLYNGYCLIPNKLLFLASRYERVQRT